MTTVVMMKNKAKEMKSLVEEGLHAFGRVMSICEELCEDSEMGERGGYYGHRDMDYPYGDRMGMRDYSEMPPYEMGERRGVRGTGRYSRY